MRKKFQEQMTDLKRSLIEMGGYIEYAIDTAVKALIRKDVALAKKAIEFDEEIDQKEREIESACMRLLLQQQPVAGDLRRISAVLKMITDMERIGDQSADISEITLMLAEEPYIKELAHMRLMAEATIRMVHESIDAYVREDTALAEEVIKSDDIVDSYFLEIREELCELIRQDAKNTHQAFDLMMIAKYLERIGDHATNIAEWVVYSLTGAHPRIANKAKTDVKPQGV